MLGGTGRRSESDCVPSASRSRDGVGDRRRHRPVNRRGGHACALDLPALAPDTEGPRHAGRRHRGLLPGCRPSFPRAMPRRSIRSRGASGSCSHSTTSLPVSTGDYRRSPDNCRPSVRNSPSPGLPVSGEERMIEVQHLRKSFGTVAAVRDISFTAPDGGDHRPARRERGRQDDDPGR